MRSKYSKKEKRTALLVRLSNTNYAFIKKAAKASKKTVALWLEHKVDQIRART